MNNGSNHNINSQAATADKEAKSGHGLVASLLRTVVGGEIFVQLGERKIIKWLFTGLLLGTLYIYNAYRVEKKSRQIQQLQRDIKRLQYDYVNNKSKLMHYSRQSSLIEQLKEEGIKASKVPPKKLFKTKAQ